MRRVVRPATVKKISQGWNRVRLLVEALERRDLLAINALTTADPSWWSSTGNAPSGGTSISGDGSIVAFESYAGNLAATSATASGTLGQPRQIFVRNTNTAQTSLISIAQDGTVLDASQPIVSQDGTAVAFLSNGQVYLRNLVNNTTKLITTTPGGVQAASGSASYLSVSANGRYIGFHGNFQDLLAADVNHDGDGYVKDTQTGTVHWLTPHPDRGFSSNVLAGPVVFTADNQYAYYVTNLNLVANDSNNANDIYRYNIQTHAISLLSVDSQGNAAGILASTVTGSLTISNVAVSTDGRYVAFSSSNANVVAGLSGTRTYLKDVTQGTTQQIALSTIAGNNGSLTQVQFSADNQYLVGVYQHPAFFPPPGTPANGIYRIKLQDGSNSAVTVLQDGTQSDDVATIIGVSSDGRTISFMTTLNGYTASDANGLADIFLRDMQTGITHLASHAVGGGAGNGNSFPSFPALGQARGFSVSSDGLHVAFTSNASNLLANDNNRSDDVFLYDGSSDNVSGLSVPLASLATNYTAGGLASFYQYGSTLMASTSGGRYVLIRSNAGDLLSTSHSGDTRQQLYLFDRTAGTRELVSINSDGVSYFSRFIDSASITPDGRYVVFVSNQNVYVRDRQASHTRQVNVNSLGAAANSSTIGDASISDDGRYVVFCSSATNLDTAIPSTNIHNTNVYLRDLVAGTTRLVSRNTTGSFSGDGTSLLARIGSDGRYVTFQSDATNLVANDNNAATDCFRYDRLSDSMMLVSVNLAGTGSANAVSALMEDTKDGRYVGFRSSASNLVSQTVNTSSQLYVRDMVTGATKLVTLAANGASGASQGGDLLTLSSDGRYAAFTSYATDLVSGMTTNGSNVYWRDLQSGQTKLISINQAGTGGSANGSNEVNLKPVISDDGRFVVFSHSGTDLVAGMTAQANNPYNVFVRDVATGKTRLLSADAAGHGGATGSASQTQPFGLSIIADGSLAFFDHGSSNLVVGDVNQASDVFVATTAPSSGVIRGAIFADLNRNSVQDPSELGLSNITVYVDANNNGAFDSGEVFAISQADGSYSLQGLEAGLHHVLLSLTSSDSQTYPAGNQPRDVTLASSTSIATGIDFGVARKLPDLTVQNVHGAATTASSGRIVTVNWNDVNVGDADATLGWSDAVYLSADDVLDPSDLLLGTFRHTIALAAGQTYNASLEVALPPVTGAYHYLVQADRRSFLSETSRANNTTASDDSILIQLPRLQLGAVLSDHFTAPGQTLYYQLDVPNGDQSVRIQASRSGGEVGIAIQNITQKPVSGLLATSLSSGSYIVAVTDFGPTTATNSFTLLASQPGSSIASSLPATAGNAGTITLQVTGNDLLNGTRFQLKAPNGTILDATRNQILDLTSGLATFDLQGRAAASYTLQAVLPSGVVVVSPVPFAVTASSPIAVGQGIDVNLTLPDEARFLRVNTFYVTVKNTTANDLPSPLVLVRSPTGTLINTADFISDQKEPDGTMPYTQAYAASNGILPGTLRPGEEVNIPFYFKVLRDPTNHFTLEAVTVQSDDVKPFDFSSIESLARPLSLTDAQWAPVWLALKARIGTTQGDYIRFLSNAANLMPAGYGNNQSPLSLLQFETARTQAQLGQSVSGTIITSDPQAKIVGRRLSLQDDSNDVTVNGYVLNDGTFFVNNVPSGVYSFRPEGFLLPGNPTVTVEQGQAVANVQLTATRGVRVSGSIASSIGLPLANATITLLSNSQSFFTQSDNTGNYLVEGLPADNYTIQVSARGYADAYLSQVAIGNNGLVRSVALATEAIVSGHVGFTGTPPSSGNMTVLVIPVNGPSGYVPAATLQNGQFIVTGLPAGVYRLKVSYTGYQDVYVAPFSVTAGQVLALPGITLTSVASLTGQVTSNVAGLSKAGLSVGIYDGNGNYLASVLTDSQGNYGLNQVVPGNYQLRVLGLNHGVSTTVACTVAAGDHLTGLNLQVTEGATIRGTAREAGGNRTLAGLAVMAIDSTGRSAYATTNDQGVFAIDSVAAGSYRVSLVSAGASAAASISVTANGVDGEVVNADLLRAAGIAHITGIVQHSDLTPIAYAGVFAYQNGVPVLVAYSDSTGFYQLDFDQTGTFDLFTIGEGATFVKQFGFGVTTGSQQAVNFTAGTSSLSLALSANGTVDDSIDVNLYQVMGTALALVDSQTVGIVGSVQWSSLVPGSYVVKAYGPNNQGVVSSFTILPGSNTQNLTLGAMALLQGMVTDAAGNPVANASVILTGSDGRTHSETTDNSGNFIAGYLESGVYSAVVLADGYQAGSTTNLAVSGSASHNFQLASNQGTTLSGRLVDEQGRAIIGMPVLVKTSDGTILGVVRTGSKGDFIITTAQGSNLTLLSGGSGGYLGITRTGINLTAGQTTSPGNLSLALVGHGTNPALPSAPQQGQGPSAAAALSFESDSIISARGFGFGGPGNLYVPTVPTPVSVQIREKFIPILTPAKEWINQINNDLAFDGIVGEPTLEELKQLLDTVPPECHADCQFAISRALSSINLLNQVKNDLDQAKKAVINAIRKFTYAAPAEFLIATGTLSSIAAFLVDFAAVAAGETLTVGAFTLSGSQKGINGIIYKAANAVPQFFADLKTIYDQMTTAANAQNKNDLQVAISVLPKLFSAAFGLFAGPSKLALAINGGASDIELFDHALKGFDGFKAVLKAADLGVVFDFKQTKETSSALDIADKTLQQVIRNYKAQVIRARNALNDLKLCFQNCDKHDNIPVPTLLSIKKDGTPVGSRDPNEKLGPNGFGTSHFVQPGSLLPYTVYFENAPNLATAPAQEVFITDQLDADADWSSFAFGNVGFGDQVITVPGGLQEYSIRLTYHNADGSSLFVDVAMKLNRATGQISWSLRSVDPVSGALPDGAQAGFLPVNDATGHGEGFVRYSIKAKSNLATGTRVENQASIIFDENDPIRTNTVVNTIDANAPVSSVAAMPATTSQPTFTVNWSGSDSKGSGIVHYDVFVSINQGPFTLWQHNTTATSASYTGVRGSRYSYYSIATDGVDLVQTTPTAAQASTLVSLDTLPVVNQVVFNNGAAQRSKIHYVQIIFNTIVKVDKNSFDLFVNNRRLVISSVSTLAINGQTWATLQFPASSFSSQSLPEGQYRLVTKAKGVKNLQGQTMQSDRTDSFYRLYGDANGDGKVDATDLALLNVAFGKKSSQTGYQWFLDWNNDGVINDVDRRAFQSRYGRHV